MEELLLPRHLTSATLAIAVKITNYNRGYGRIAAITTPSRAREGPESLVFFHLGPILG